MYYIDIVAQKYVDRITRPSFVESYYLCDIAYLYLF